MSFNKIFPYHIFISYAHFDNLPTSWENLGWIEKFYKDLDTLFKRRTIGSNDIKIWWDAKKLDGSILFNDSIEEGIKESAILICLNSPRYLGSQFCRQELDLFSGKALSEPFGLKIANRSRILNVLMYNIPHDEWPPALAGATGFAFHDAKEADDLGDPLDTRTLEYKAQLENLRDVIEKLINSFPKEEKPEPVPDDRFTIYMGEVADTLSTTRKRTISELEKKGYKIIQGIPPPYEVNEHEKKITETVQKANLSVHLLDQYPGREIEGTQDIWYPQKQAELGLKFSKSKLIWVPSELDHSLIEEEAYKVFLQGLEQGKQPAKSFEYIRGAKSTLTQEISEYAEQIKLQQQRKPDYGKVSVLLDTHFKDQIYAWDLGKILVDNQIQPFINPQEDDPGKNIETMLDRVRQVSKLIFFYGEVSVDWVRERIGRVIHLAITNKFPIKECYVLMLPPHKSQNEIYLEQGFLKINVVDNSNNAQLSAPILQQFLKDLKDDDKVEE